MPGFQSTRLVTEGALEPFFFLYTDDSIQGNPETCKQSNVMLNYEVKNIKLSISGARVLWKEGFIEGLLSMGYPGSPMIKGTWKAFLHPAPDKGSGF